MTIADNTKPAQVAPYPGLFPFTCPLINVSTGVVYWSSLLASLSFQPGRKFLYLIKSEDFIIFTFAVKINTEPRIIDVFFFGRLLTEISTTEALRVTKQ